MGKVAIVLSGCGYLDGAEIHESVLTMLYLEKAGHSYACFAPDKDQAKVVNHLTKDEFQTDHRNVLLESARIARGKINSFDTLSYKSFDGIILPGGFGVALNLSDFAVKGVDCTVDETLKEILIGFYKAKRPIGATCISPMLLAAVFKEIGVQATMTVGSSEEQKKILESFGMIGKIAKVDESVSDHQNKVYTTPCYMEPDDLAGMSEGVESMIKEFL